MADIPANNRTTQTLKIDVGKRSAVEVPNDEDWFKLNLKAGNTYYIASFGALSGRGTLGDPFLNLYDSRGRLITSDDDSHPDGRSAQITFRPTVSGTFYAGARGFAGSTGTYEIKYGLTDPSATVNTDRTVKLGANSFKIDPPGDVDWAAINLTGGRNYRFALGRTAGSNPNFDPILEIRNSKGQLLASDDDSGGNLNALLNFRPSASGKYFVAVSDFGNNDVGNANLQISLA